MKLLGPVAATLFVLAALTFSVWAAVRNYRECRATPHTAFYCLTETK